MNRFCTSSVVSAFRRSTCMKKALSTTSQIGRIESGTLLLLVCEVVLALMRKDDCDGASKLGDRTLESKDVLEGTTDASREHAAGSVCLLPAPRRTRSFCKSP
jgi:hypothetical protein